MEQSIRRYPIQPKRKPDRDLPFIPAAEVHEQDGKNGSRLCQSGSIQDQRDEVLADQ